MKRLDLDSYFLEIAKTVSLRSTCSRGNTGCVIARDKRVIATGYNGTPSGAPHEPHKHSKEECNAIHAEINALNMVAPWQCEGASVYITRSPCPVCSSKLIKYGFDKVVFSDKHSSFEESLALFADTKILFQYKPHITYEEVH